MFEGEWCVSPACSFSELWGPIQHGVAGTASPKAAAFPVNRRSSRAAVAPASRTSEVQVPQARRNHGNLNGTK